MATSITEAVATAKPAAEPRGGNIVVPPPVNGTVCHRPRGSVSTVRSAPYIHQTPTLAGQGRGGESSPKEQVREVPPLGGRARTPTRVSRRNLRGPTKSATPRCCRDPLLPDGDDAGPPAQAYVELRGVHMVEEHPKQRLALAVRHAHEALGPVRVDEQHLPPGDGSRITAGWRRHSRSGSRKAAGRCRAGPPDRRAAAGSARRAPPQAAYMLAHIVSPPTSGSSTGAREEGRLGGYLERRAVRVPAVDPYVLHGYQIRVDVRRLACGHRQAVALLGLTEELGERHELGRAHQVVELEEQHAELVQRATEQLCQDDRWSRRAPPRAPGLRWCP